LVKDPEGQVLDFLSSIAAASNNKLDLIQIKTRTKRARKYRRVALGIFLQPWRPSPGLFLYPAH
jgi:hypothetical protein